LTSIEQILAQVRVLVEPNRLEVQRFQAGAAKIKALVESTVAAKSLEVLVELGGSYAKGTWLKGELELDIFVKFPPGISRKDFETLGVSIGQESMKEFTPALRYSEHPYVEAYTGEISVNIVPCYDVPQGAWMSAADRSPYHTQFMMGRLDDKLRSEIRLLKGFCRRTGIYGAEIKTRGFSGYACEVLTLKYHTFLNVLNEASRYRAGQVISIDGEVAPHLIDSSPMVLIDPVDKSRNLGSAISAGNVARLILAAQTFLKRPSVKYFKGGERELPAKELIGHIVSIVFDHSSRPADTLWGELKKSERKISSKLKRMGYDVLRSTSASDEASQSAIVLLVSGLILPEVYDHLGPNVTLGHSAEEFLDRYRTAGLALWLDDDGRLHSILRRTTTNVKAGVEHMISKPEGLGLAQGLVQDITDGKVLLGQQAFDWGAGKAWYRSQVLELLRTDSTLDRP
jgi:tRNA nucleotidyltransferase (CCA-adding enzyme)